MAPRARRLANNPGRSPSSKSTPSGPRPSPHAIERETREHDAGDAAGRAARSECIFEDRHRVVVERRRRGASSRIQWSASHVDGVVVV